MENSAVLPVSINVTQKSDCKGIQKQRPILIGEQFIGKFDIPTNW